MTTTKILLVLEYMTSLEYKKLILCFLLNFFKSGWKYFRNYFHDMLRKDIGLQFSSVFLSIFWISLTKDWFYNLLSTWFLKPGQKLSKVLSIPSKMLLEFFHLIAPRKLIIFHRFNAAQKVISKLFIFTTHHLF